MPVLAADFEALDATGSSSSSNGSGVVCIGDEEDDDSAGLLCVCNADLCNSYRERGDRTG